MELLEALRLRHARAGARPPGADRRSRRTCRCPASGGRRCAWLDTCGLEPAAISVIPGNHDAYVEEVVATRAFEKLFAPYMTDDLRRRRRRATRADYPFVQLRDGVAFVGVTSSWRPATRARGARIGEAQLARLEALLAAPELAGKTRVVLIHHPPVRHKHGEERNLRDRAALAAVLARVRRRPGAARPRSPGRARRAARAGRQADPGHRRRLGVVHGRRPSGGRATTCTRSRAARSRWITRAHDEATDAFREVRARAARAERSALSSRGSASTRTAA